MGQKGPGGVLAPVCEEEKDLAPGVIPAPLQEETSKLLPPGPAPGLPGPEQPARREALLQPSRQPTRLGALAAAVDALQGEEQAFCARGHRPLDPTKKNPFAPLFRRHKREEMAEACGNRTHRDRLNRPPPGLKPGRSTSHDSPPQRSASPILPVSARPFKASGSPSPDGELPCGPSDAPAEARCPPLCGASEGAAPPPPPPLPSDRPPGRSAPSRSKRAAAAPGPPPKGLVSEGNGAQSPSRSGRGKGRGARRNRRRAESIRLRTQVSRKGARCPL